MDAYILIGLGECDEQKVLEELSKNKEVVEANILFGEWDLIAKIQAENSEAIATFVMEKIRKNDDIKLTSTLIVAK